MFTHDWSTVLAESLLALWPAPPQGPMRCLEVGSFEGRGSLKIVSHLCGVQGSLLYCVDPWDDVYVAGQTHPLDGAFAGQYARFTHNTAGEERIVALRGTLSDFAEKLRSEGELDFAYVDGDHSEQGAYADAALAWSLLRPGGVLLFDDYCPSWGVYEAVRRFRADTGAQVALENGTQIAFRKPGEDQVDAQTQ